MAQRPMACCIRPFFSAYTAKAVKTTAMATKAQRQSPLSSMPKAAPELWMFTRLTMPGISSREPVFSTMLIVTQYFSHWSSIRTRTTARA